MNQLIEMNGQMTMGTKEIAKLLERDHSDIRRSAKRLVDSGVINGGQPLADTPYTNDQNGQTYYEYRLNKLDSITLVAQNSPQFTAALVKRWDELERGVAKPAELSRIEILQMALESERARVEAEAKLAIAAPKAEFVDRYVEATGTYGFRLVAKMLSVKENWFSDFLIEMGIMYRLGGKLTAHSEHLDAGRFVARAGVAKNEHAYTECRFTAKGVEWVAGEIAKHKAVAAIAKK